MIGASFDTVLAAAQRGDEAAFSILWRDIQPALLRYLRVATGEAAAGSRATAVIETADDVAADTWIDIVRALPDFTGGEAAFRGWIFTVARHRAIDAARRASRRPARPVPNEALEWMPTADDPAAAAVEADATARALALIALLPPDQAEVVMLRVVGGLDVDQVAKIVGKRAGTVRVLSHRGLRRLADRLQDRNKASSSGGVG